MELLRGACTGTTTRIGPIGPVRRERCCGCCCWGGDVDVDVDVAVGGEADDDSADAVEEEEEDEEEDKAKPDGEVLEAGPVLAAQAAAEEGWRGRV